MSIVANLPKALSAGGRKLFSGTASITGTGSIDTGLDTLDGYTVSVADAATTVPTDVASITSVTDGTVDVVVVNLAAAANTIETAAKTVALIATGY